MVSLLEYNRVALKHQVDDTQEQRGPQAQKEQHGLIDQELYQHEIMTGVSRSAQDHGSSQDQNSRKGRAVLTETV